MKSFRPLPAYEQVAAHLREEILHRDLGNTMPGVRQIIRTLGVSQKTVVAALRILEHEGMRLPEPGLPERAFLDELKASGLPVGDYNLPNWEETNEGLAKVLELLFAVTPPTALIIDEPGLYMAVQHILGTHGIWAPRQVSLICSETHALFKWSTPTISHMRWDEERVVPRITRWASALSRGRRDVTQTLLPNEFVPGGSIGPAPSERSWLK